VSADEERTAIGDHRENERYHHLTSYPLMQRPEALQAADSEIGPSFDDLQVVAKQEFESYGKPRRSKFLFARQSPGISPNGRSFAW
jgi:hypothetical protein